jgi:colicin import membrane protein
MSASIFVEANRISAGALALLVHLIFFTLLYVSFSWQMKPPQGMVVDLWENLPDDIESPVQPPPPTPEPQPPAKVVKVEVAKMAPVKADIEFKSKKQKLKVEPLNLDTPVSKSLAEKRAEAAERRLEEMERQADARAQARRKVQSESAIASGKVVDEYVGKIAAKIRRYIVLPPGVAKNIKAEFSVTLLPGGEVLNANLARSSGSEAYDSAVERAILKAQPLPLPPAEQKMFDRFRDLRLKFSPAESGQ